MGECCDQQEQLQEFVSTFGSCCLPTLKIRCSLHRGPKEEYANLSWFLIDATQVFQRTNVIQSFCTQTVFSAHPLESSGSLGFLFAQMLPTEVQI
jgi:hypothetical protein